MDTMSQETKDNKSIFSEVIEKQIDNSILLSEIVNLLNQGHTATLALKGYSMRPFLEHNRDKALLAKPANIKERDAVLAEIAPGYYVLHRIIKIDGNNVTLQGDGNLLPEYCQLKDIKAIVVGFYRKGRSQLDRTDAAKWRIYSAIWLSLKPIRRYLLAIYKRICITQSKQ